MTGRVSRLRIERRLALARHGATLLDRKQRILADELDRLSLHAQTATEQWEEAARTAAVWLQRALALDGALALTEARPADAATVEVHGDVTMGVAYPAHATCTIPMGPPGGGSSALTLAVRAHREALARAVVAAAAERAVRLVTAELAATRRRQHAVESRWIPRLEEELATVHRLLEQQDLEETLRIHWAAENLGGRDD